MQRVYNLDKWFRLDEGKSLKMKAGKPRRIRIEVNSPAEAALYAVIGGVDPIFLALVKGRDLVEFNAPGGEAFEIAAEGTSVYLYTVDGVDVHSVADGSESFVRLMERKPRNREAELMQYHMQQNMQRMLNAQAEELERRFERSLASRSALDASKGAPAGAGKKPASDGDGKQPDTKPSETAGGSAGDDAKPAGDGAGRKPAA